MDCRRTPVVTEICRGGGHRIVHCLPRVPERRHRRPWTFFCGPRLQTARRLLQRHRLSGHPWSSRHGSTGDEGRPRRHPLGHPRHNGAGTHPHVQCGGRRRHRGPRGPHHAQWRHLGAAKHQRYRLPVHLERARQHQGHPRHARGALHLPLPRHLQHHGHHHRRERESRICRRERQHRRHQRVLHGRLDRHRLRCRPRHQHHDHLRGERRRRSRRRSHRPHRLLYRRLLRHCAHLRPALPRHTRGSHSPRTHRGGHDDDVAHRENQLGRPRRGPAGLHHDGGDALLLQHQRRHPHRPDKLRAPQRLLRPLQEHHPHHVGAGRTLHPTVYIHLNSWRTFVPRI